MADVTTMPPATHNQPSRKGKKAWRKNVDLSEVQHGLEQARDEIIKTGGVIAEKPADELFATDLTGDVETAKQQQSKKVLKADEILALRSAVPGLDGRKRKAIEIPTAIKKQKNGKYVSHRELQRLRAIADGAHGGLLDDEAAASHDPWAISTPKPDSRLNYIDEAKPTREPSTLKHAPKSLATNGKSLPHVRKPDAGKSYNPRLRDWEALLEREGAAELEAEKQRLTAKAAAEAQEARAEEEAAKVEAAEKEEYAADYDSAWESEWDGFNSEAEQEVFAMKQRSRMTSTERNKAKAKKAREAKAVHEMKQRARDAQERRIKQIAKEVSAKDQARGAHISSLSVATGLSDSEASDDDRHVQLKRRRMRQAPIPDAPLEVVLPDELEGSLRRLKPEGNLMQERYRNFLVNGKVEARRKVWQKKQAKTTSSEKWSYKDWKLR